MLRKLPHILVATIVLSFAGYTWYQHAWIFEDAFITFRVIDNFIHGEGLRWNVTERVQVFTHPLWLFLLAPAYFLSREVILTASTISALCTLAMIVSLYASKLYRSSLLTSGLILVLCVTKTFPTYSSSGFENPLSHLLICLFCILILRDGVSASPFLAALLAGLSMLARPDTGLLYIPTLAAICLAQKRCIRWVVLGLVPIIGWEIFSLFYYGVFVPNTALAKIPHGISRLVILRQGWAYVMDLFSKDLLAASIISLPFLYFLTTAPQSRPHGEMRWWRNRYTLLNAGIVAYCMYVVSIGGDYLSYRFWSVPLVASAIVGLHWLQQANRVWLCRFSKMSIVIALAIIGVSYATLLTVDASVVTLIGDDRLNDFFSPLKLPVYIQHNMNLDHAWKKAGLRLREQVVTLGEGKPLVIKLPNVGVVGYYAGPGVHIVDSHALTDPLLARLPTRGSWRIGHFPRAIPPGYAFWLRDGDASRLPAALQEYVPILGSVTRAPVFSAPRLRQVVPFALGVYDRPLQYYVNEAPPSREVENALVELSQRSPAVSPHDVVNGEGEVLKHESNQLPGSSEKTAP